jgi:acyl-coenzyme A thioesterase PaaI-like protein
MTLQASARSFWEVPEPTTDAWRAKRRLATALRHLAALCVASEAPAAALTYAADAAERIAERLQAHPRRAVKQGFSTITSEEELAIYVDRATLTGHSNPYAPPMALSMEGDTGVGVVTFPAPFEGVPGFVHGGLVAAAFDQVFGYLQSNRGSGALTGELTVRYRKPTPIESPLRIEAHLVRVEGRRSFLSATMRAGERVTADAEAIFVTIDAERFRGAIAADKPVEERAPPERVES